MRCEGSIAVTPPVVVYVSRRIGASLRADQTYCYSTGADVALCAGRLAGFDHLRAGIEIIVRGPARLALDEPAGAVILIAHDGRAAGGLDQPTPRVVLRAQGAVGIAGAGQRGHVAGVVVDRLDSDAGAGGVGNRRGFVRAVGLLLLRGAVVGEAVPVARPAQVPRLVDAVVPRGRFQPVQGVVPVGFAQRVVQVVRAALNVAGLIVGVAVAVGCGVVAVVAPDLIADPAEAVEGGIGVVAAAVVQLDLGLLEILGGNRVEPQVAVGGKRLAGAVVRDGRKPVQAVVGRAGFSVVVRDRAIEVGVLNRREPIAVAGVVIVADVGRAVGDGARGGVDRNRAGRVLVLGGRQAGIVVGHVVFVDHVCGGLSVGVVAGDRREGSLDVVPVCDLHDGGVDVGGVIHAA